MGTKDRRIDEYIADAPPFAKPILNQIRSVVHQACPDVEETLKWKLPTFMYKDGILCGMASFKEHAVLGFWKGTLIYGETGKSLEAMGHFGRMKKVSDLPPKKTLAGYVKQAMKLNEEGIKVPRKPKAAKPAPKTPADLSAALKRNKKALATYESFSPSHKREYIEWLEEAKREETRNQRLETAVQWMAQGKPRMWKYMKK